MILIKSKSFNISTELLLNTKITKIIVFIILNFVANTIYAQRDIEDMENFIKSHPRPKGTYLDLKEALVSPDKVLHLKLTGMGIDKFPVEILKFKNLVELGLDDNNIQELPSWIERLTKLQKLHLRNNKLKTIPESLFFLPSLRELDLWGNQITYFPQIKNIKSTFLEELNLSMNLISNLPINILELTYLKRLRLENNKFTKIPSVVFRMKKLEMLNLLNNQIYDFSITTPIDCRLKGIDLAFNPISENKVSELRKLLPNCTIYTQLE